MTTAYDRIDRFLRKNLSDDNYLSYKDELDAICQAKIQRTEQDWDALAEKQLASITRDMKATAEDALVRAAHKVMAELESQEPVQVSPLEFVEMVMEKEHLIGKPIFWAEWPSREKNT